MLATSLPLNSEVVKTIVDVANSIIEQACDCVTLCDRDIVWDTSHKTFLSVIRNLSLNVVDGRAVDFVFTVPTEIANCWITDIDPFVFAEALREIRVDMRCAAFDAANSPGLQIGVPGKYGEIYSDTASNTEGLINGRPCPIHS